MQATHLLNSHHRNMNEMWAEMSEEAREEYKEFFIAYHDSIARYGTRGFSLPIIIFMLVLSGIKILFNQP